MAEKKYQMVLRAEGEVRDKDGNLVSTESLEGQTVLTEEQAQQIREALQKQGETP